MDKVLIVDSDKKFLEKLSEGFSRLLHFDLLTAGRGEQALEILSRGDISVLVTGVDIPGIDGLELLAYVTRKFFNMPCIVMSDHGKPWFFKSSRQQENLYYIEKPSDAATLSSAIIVALSLRDEGTSANGFTLSSFLPIIEMAKKTCCLWVFGKENGKGYLFFEDGVLIDAVYKSAPPAEALAKMLTWSGVELLFSDLLQDGTNKRLHKNVIDLVGATWKKNDVVVTGRQYVEKNVKNAPPADISKVQLVVQKYFGVHYSRIRTIKGYRALGIVDSALNLVAGHDLAGVLNLKNSTPRQSNGLDPLALLTSMKLFADCRMMSVQTSEMVAQVLSCDLASSCPLFIVGVTDSDGNWVFMKHEMGKINTLLLQLSDGRFAGGL